VVAVAGVRAEVGAEPVTPVDDDFRDGLCDPSIDHGPPTRDEDAPYVAFFADLLDYDGNPRDANSPAYKARLALWRAILIGRSQP
jgi:hypothetical protein